MFKETYTEQSFEIVLLENDDIIVTSTGHEPGETGKDNW